MKKKTRGKGRRGSSRSGRGSGRSRAAVERDGEFWFDEDAAQLAVDFFHELLVHVKGPLAGQAFILEPWQEQITRDLFGWKRPDGTRRYRKALVEIPKKNGKTTWLAGIALLLLVSDGELSAEVYSAAADREQAAIVFETARQMVEASPELDQALDVFRRSMVYPELGGSWKVMSADAPTKHGVNASGVMFDELHAQKSRDLYDTLEGAGAARAQPLHVYATTAGNDHNSIGYEVYQYAKKVRDGVIDDPHFYVAIFEAEEGDDWTDPEVWRKANPNLGVSVSEDFLREECTKAQGSPARQNSFRQLHLNQWVRQRVRWLDLAKWDACAGDLMPAQIEAENEGRLCYAGLDLASTEDIAALVLVFPPDDDEAPFDVVCRFFVPEEGAAIRERRDRVPYQTWARDGWIIETPGNVTDYRAIRREIRQLGGRFNIAEIPFDRWGAQGIQSELADDGFEMVQFGQGFGSMAAPTKELLHLVLAERIRHGGHPVLRWMADNLVVRMDPAGNVKPDKSKSTEKIDGMVALVMGLARAIVREEATSTVSGELLFV